MSAEQNNSEGKGKGFTVTDRRGVDAESPPPEQASTTEEQTGAEERKLPELDFSTFILSLSTSAMVHLGEAPHPDGSRRRDLGLAKQSIDILGMLKEKTAGNLTAEEARLIDELLYDLRLRYVTASQ